jgi:hypothetical protein
MKKTMKSDRRSLRLASETIRSLDAQQLGRVDGGSDDTSFTSHPQPNTQTGHSRCLVCYQ